jgi:hypothetical protein
MCRELDYVIGGLRPELARQACRRRQHLAGIGRAEAPAPNPQHRPARWHGALQRPARCGLRSSLAAWQASCQRGSTSNSSTGGSGPGSQGTGTELARAPAAPGALRASLLACGLAGRVPARGKHQLVARSPGHPARSAAQAPASRSGRAPRRRAGGRGCQLMARGDGRFHRARDPGAGLGSGENRARAADGIGLQADALLMAGVRSRSSRPLGSLAFERSVPDRIGLDVHRRKGQLAAGAPLRPSPRAG